MTLNATPMPHQIEGRNFALPRKYSLNGDQMGLGKSLQSLMVTVDSKRKSVLIVCPAFLVPNWHAEIDKFLEEPRPEFTVVSYSSLKGVEDRFSEFDMVICDEVHYAKNTEAQRTKRLHKLLAKHRPEYFMGLSGTAIKNRVPEFWSLLKLCWLGGKYPEFDKFSRSSWAFSAAFANKKITPYGTKFEGIKNIKELKELVAPVYIRRRAEDVLDLPPEIDREVIFKDRDTTDSLLASAWESYEGKKQSRTFASGKAISALAKVEYTAEFVKENLEEMGKVLIYTDHVQSAKKLFNELPGSRFITGATSTLQRAEYVQAINEGEISILIATIGALSVGVNITGVNHMIFNDLSWVPADISQARKRIHRIGQTKTCFYYYILASQIDKAITRTLEKKRKILEAIET